MQNYNVQEEKRLWVSLFFLKIHCILLHKLAAVFISFIVHDDVPSQLLIFQKFLLHFGEENQHSVEQRKTENL